MGFTRNWDASCPRVYDAWEAAGAKWVIQDLAPEDDETAIRILEDNFLEDEVLCNISKVPDDPTSLRGITEFWRESIKQRMSLGCYVEIEGQRSLVALNVCVVDVAEERFPAIEIEGFAWNNVFKAMVYVETKCDPFKYLGLDRILHALGLVVKKEYRGHKLGSRILAARQPLCVSHGIKATATVFTGPASQKSAARSGFDTICVASLKELAEHGMDYPLDDSRVIKLMIKRYFD